MNPKVGQRWGWVYNPQSITFLEITKITPSHIFANVIKVINTSNTPCADSVGKEHLLNFNNRCLKFFLGQDRI